MTITIKRNRHWARVGFLRRLIPVFGNVDVTFLFHSDCWYPKKSVVNNGYKTLYGRTYGLLPHRNSIKVVWMPDYENIGRFSLLISVKRKGKVITEFSINVNRAVFYRLKITHKGGIKVVTIGEANYEFARHTVGIKENGLGWRFWPNFDGKDHAYKTMNFELDEK